MEFLNPLKKRLDPCAIGSILRIISQNLGIHIMIMSSSPSLWKEDVIIPAFSSSRFGCPSDVASPKDNRLPRQPLINEDMPVQVSQAPDYSSKREATTAMVVATNARLLCILYSIHMLFRRDLLLLQSPCCLLLIGSLFMNQCIFIFRFGRRILPNSYTKERCT